MDKVQQDELKKLKDWFGRIALDLMADDFDEAMHRWTTAVKKHLKTYPEDKKTIELWMKRTEGLSEL